MGKDILFVLMLTVLSLTTSCHQTARQIGHTVKDGVLDRPHYLRDSEEWGDVIRKTLDLTDFENIRTAGYVDITFTQADEYSVVAEANERVLALYDFRTDNDCLVIDTEREDFNDVPCMRLLVSAPSLSQIDIDGLGDVFMREGVELFNDFTLNMNGLGDIKIDSLLCDNFVVRLDGLGDINVRRLSCASADIKLDGSGDIDLKRIKCQESAHFVTNGLGDIDARVSCTVLNIEVNGSGEADIDADCDDIVASVSGTGSIELEGITHTIKTKKQGLGTISTKHLRTK